MCPGCRSTTLSGRMGSTRNLGCMAGAQTIPPTGAPYTTPPRCTLAVSPDLRLPSRHNCDRQIAAALCGSTIWMFECLRCLRYCNGIWYIVNESERCQNRSVLRFRLSPKTSLFRSAGAGRTLHHAAQAHPGASVATPSYPAVFPVTCPQSPGYPPCGCLCMVRYHSS